MEVNKEDTIPLDAENPEPHPSEQRIVVGLEFSPDIEKIKCVLVNTLDAKEIQVFWLNRVNIDTYHMYTNSIINGIKIGSVIRYKGPNGTPHTWYGQVGNIQTPVLPGLRAAAERLAAVWYQANYMALQRAKEMKRNGNIDHSK